MPTDALAPTPPPSSPASRRTVEAELLPSIPVPLEVVPHLAQVANAMGSDHDWGVVERWARVVGLEVAAIAVHAVAAVLDPTNTWTVARWQQLLDRGDGAVVLRA